MTREQRTRAYCCFKPCPHCGAQRGEYCSQGRGRVWTKGYHWMRGPFSDRPRFDSEEARKRYYARYTKLKQQILRQAEVPGHE